MTTFLTARVGLPNPAQLTSAPARTGPAGARRTGMLGAFWRANPQTGLLECSWSADSDTPPQSLIAKLGMTLAIYGQGRAGLYR